MMSKYEILTGAIAAIVIFCFTACTPNVGNTSVSVETFLSDSVNRTTAVKSLQTDFSNPPEYDPGFINSGAPDFIKLTLMSISVFSDGNESILWTGSKELMLDGSSLDLTDINTKVKDIPEGSYQAVMLVFDSVAKIKGSFTGRFDMGDGTSQELTIYTKSDFSYNPEIHTGGAASYIDFTSGPAEEMDLGLGTDGSTIDLTTEANFTIVEGEISSITILFDLNRMLRFYNGKHPDPGHGGVNPDDPTDSAYFFAHSVFQDSVAVFMGQSGRIEGYQALYGDYSGEVGVGTPYGVKGWMTLIFDSSDNFISGHIIGDDDNALTVAKGELSVFTAAEDSMINFTYILDGGATTYDVTGFIRQENIDSSSPIALYNGSNLNHSMEQHGEAMFILKHIQ